VQKSLMPKGVDHLRGRTDSSDPSPVQKSLMPKGVDHPNAGVTRRTLRSAKIFDAERR